MTHNVVGMRSREFPIVSCHRPLFSAQRALPISPFLKVVASLGFNIFDFSLGLPNWKVFEHRLEDLKKRGNWLICQNVTENSSLYNVIFKTYEEIRYCTESSTINLFFLSCANFCNSVCKNSAACFAALKYTLTIKILVEFPRNIRQ